PSAGCDGEGPATSPTQGQPVGETECREATFCVDPGARSGAVPEVTPENQHPAAPVTGQPAPSDGPPPPPPPADARRAPVHPPAAPAAAAPPARSFGCRVERGAPGPSALGAVLFGLGALGARLRRTGSCGASRRDHTLGR